MLSLKFQFGLRLLSRSCIITTSNYFTFIDSCIKSFFFLHIIRLCSFLFFNVEVKLSHCSFFSVILWAYMYMYTKESALGCSGNAFLSRLSVSAGGCRPWSCKLADCAGAHRKSNGGSLALSLCFHTPWYLLLLLEHL